jgi:hypothetical protein
VADLRFAYYPAADLAEETFLIVSFTDDGVEWLGKNCAAEIGDPDYREGTNARTFAYAPDRASFERLYQQAKDDRLDVESADRSTR